MQVHHHRLDARDTRSVAPWLGLLGGVGGFVHGVGEVRQGNVPSGGVVFKSWVDGPIATHLGGEPAMSLVPNLLAAGVLTLLMSTGIVVWAAGPVRGERRSGLLVLLSIGLLLVGGGFGPPVIGVLAGAAGMVISASHGRRHAGLPGRRGSTLAALWPWVFWLCLVDTAFLVVGSVTLAGLFGMDAPSLFVYGLFVAVVALPLVALSGVAHDARPAPGLT